MSNPNLSLDLDKLQDQQKDQPTPPEQQKPIDIVIVDLNNREINQKVSPFDFVVLILVNADGTK